MAIGRCFRQHDSPSRCTISDPGAPLCSFSTTTCAYSLPAKMLTRAVAAGDKLVIPSAKTITSPNGATYSLTAGMAVTALEAEKNGTVKVQTPTKIIVIPVSIVNPA